jgi:hypothetical protein
MKLSLPPKLVEKLVWVPVISFLQQSKLSEILPTIGLNNNPLSKWGHYQIRHSPEVTAKGSMEFW